MDGARGAGGGWKEVAERRETVGEVGGNKVAAISSDKGRRGRGEGGKEGRRVWEKVSFPFDSLVAELFRFVPPGTDKEKAEKEGKSEARFRGEREIAVFIDSKSIDSRASESRAKY